MRLSSNRLWVTTCENTHRIVQYFEISSIQVFIFQNLGGIPARRQLEYGEETENDLTLNDMNNNKKRNLDGTDFFELNLSTHV